MSNWKRIILDIEANGLIEHMLDFSSRPFKLKDTARLWCISLRNMDNLSEVKRLELAQCTKENLKKEFENIEELIFHNGVKYDAPVLQLFGVLDYTIGYIGQASTVFGKPVKITDTMIWSKLLNQDRFGGHGLEPWGKRLGNYKTDYRQVCIDKGYIEKTAPQGAEFQAYFPETGDYCDQDTSTTGSILTAIIKEAGDWEGWYNPYLMEIKLADLTLRQELFGFDFDIDLGKTCVIELNETLQKLTDKVNPLLPPKMLNKGEQKDYTPPKNQFKKDGTPSAHMINFLKKYDAKLEELEDKTYMVYDDKKFLLPYHDCIKEYITSNIDDLDNLKAYLLDLGWDPIEWKERDLTKDAKKQKLTGDKLLETITRYVENTLISPYKKYRLNLLGIEDPLDLQTVLESKIGSFAIRVPVSPAIRVGTDKKLCPNLKKLGEKASFAADVTEYLTLRHRKNSIAGGKEDEDGEPLTGFLSMVREDGRISTPADTLGANGGRYKHKGVCNIPRATSLYGDKMRSLFGAGEGFRQFGFDFASLEARIQGHYVIPYTDGEILAESLIAERPNDIHCFDTETEILTEFGWLTYDQLNTNTRIAQWNKKNREIDYVIPNEIIINKNYSGKMITVEGDRLSMKLTPEHRVILYNETTEKYVDVFSKELKVFNQFSTESYVPNCGSLIDEQALSGIIKHYIIDNCSKLEEVQDKPSGYVVSSYDKDLIDEIQEELLLSDCNSFIITKQKNGKILYQTKIPKILENSKGNYLKHSTISEEDYTGTVWCVSVPTTYVICRRNSKVFISGNSINARKLGIDRDSAKSFSYACMYGAQAAKLAKMLRISVKEAERLFKAYWEAVPALKELKDKIERYWESKNKEFILGIDGRKLLVRSRHSLINLLFQSAGAIAAKYTIVNTCEQLEKQGLLGDPLVDDEFTEKVYLMIVYHDEAQFATPFSLIPTKYFNTEEEAEKFSKETEGASSVGHLDDKYYVSLPNPLSEILYSQIDKVCEDLKLKVPLGIEWVTGSNWYQCH